MKNFILILSVIFSIVLLSLGLRGISGNPTAESINSNEWKEDGPLELSPERGRFALLFSYVEDGSAHFSLPIARFATPDLGFHEGKYVSLFAPGLSFLSIPGYMIGKSLGVSQVGAFAVVALFGLLNTILIRSIAVRLGANSIAASIAGFAYLFATPSFPYAVTLYQHHPSTFLMLVSIYVLLRWNNFWSLAIVWMACAASIPLDYPNLFLMLPIGIYALTRFFSVTEDQKKYTFNFKWPYIFSLLFLLPPLLFFLWFNNLSYGNPLQFSGTVAAVKSINEQGLPAAPDFTTETDLEKYTDPEQQEKSAVLFFNTRFLINGFYTQFISLDRGILMYAPIVFISIAGMWLLYKQPSKRVWLSVLLSVMGANIVLYAMWGDPYGGWAFGSRYLIPTYAVAMIFVALALSSYKKSIPFVLLVLVLLIYSFGVNTIGALTSNRNPPKVEVLGLEALSGVQQKYTYTRNMDMLDANRSKSYIYQEFLDQTFSAWQYTYTVIGIGSLYFILSTLLLVLSKEK